MFRNLNSKMMALVFVISGVGCFSNTPSSDPGSAPVDPSTGLPTTGTQGGGSTPGGAGSGMPENTFDHLDLTVDPYQVLARIQVEGPPEISTRMHSCGKMKYKTVGNVLAQLGIANTTGNQGNGNSAGVLFRNGDSALGAPAENYATFMPETTMITAASAVKMQDIGLQGAAEMLNTSRLAMPNPTYVQAGTAYPIVDKDATTPTDTTLWRCNRFGLSAILGLPATQSHLDLCNAALQDASNVALANNGITNGLRTNEVFAVAAVFNAGNMCE